VPAKAGTPRRDARLGRTAVDPDLLCGQPAGGVAGQEGNHRGDLRGPAQSADWVRPVQFDRVEMRAAHCDSVAIDALVAAGAKGLVIAGVGRGGMTGSQTAAVRKAAAKGVVVITSTRTGSGRVPVGTTGNTIGSGDLNPQKARVLLALALTRTNDPVQVRKIFTENQ